MGCTPSTPANGTRAATAASNRAPDAASGKVALYAPSTKGQHHQHRKGSLILTRDASSPTSATFLPSFAASSAADDPSHEEFSGEHNNINNNNNNGNNVFCCPRLFGFGCCHQCLYRASTNGRGMSYRGHHQHYNQKRISASLTGLHSLDPESTAFPPSGTCTPSLSTSANKRSSCSSLCSVCNQLEEASSTVVQHQQITTYANVNSSSHLNCISKTTSGGSSHAHQLTPVQQQWHLSAICSCQQSAEGAPGGQHSSVATSDSKLPNKGEKGGKKKGAKPEKGHNQQSKSSKLSEVMRLMGSSESDHCPATNATLNSKEGGGVQLQSQLSHNTTSANRCSPLPSQQLHHHSGEDTTGSTKESVILAASGNSACCLKHQHRYYRQQYHCSSHRDHHHHWHCSSQPSCPPPKCCFTQILEGSSPMSETTLLQTTAPDSSAPSNRRQSESRTNTSSEVNNNRSGNSGIISTNRFQQQQQLTSSVFTLPTTATSTTNSALLFGLSSKGKSMERSAVAGSNASQGTFRGTKKQWASQSVRLGRMKIENKKAKTLLVLGQADSAGKTVQLAAEHVDFAVSNVLHSAEAAFNAFVELQPEIVIIDARCFPSISSSSSLNSNPSNSSRTTVNSSSNQHSAEKSNHFDPLTICKSIRDFKGGEFTCILALVNPSQVESAETSDVALLLQNGFNRCLVESTNLNLIVNELIQVREFELGVQRRLRAASALLVAVEACKDGVLITGPSHEIQFANHSIEKMFGFRVEELIGRKAQDYFQSDLLKADIDERINNFNEGKGEWEGQIAHRRKSGDSVPIWNRILPVNYHNGSPEYIIYVKEFPFLFIEKLMSPETETSLTYGSLRGLRKTSFDVKSEVRRPSLAKFNSVSMIEAPITRVINILMAIKENGPNFLAPTLEKAIDILKNSEIFLPQFQSFKPEDQITSELVSNLINSSKQSGVRRMSHEAASNKSSLSLANTSSSLQNSSSPSSSNATTASTSPSQSVTTTATASNTNTTVVSSSGIQPSLANVPPAVQALLEHQLSWSFNVIELERVTNKRPLTWLGMSILRHFNVPATLQCSETTIRNWLAVIEKNYHDNPYHNSTHAADVMQATAFFLRSKRITAALDPMDQAISLIAAIIHDIDHPGRNSAFLCNSSHQLAILYNDISVLESHHAARGFSLTVGNSATGADSVNIFSSLGPELYRDVRQSVIDMVLATDMTKHFEHLAKFIQNFNAVAGGGVVGVGGTLLDDCETLLELENTESEADSQDTLTAEQQQHKQDTAEQTCSDMTPENIVLIKRMLIKCADVSNPARPLKLCQTWAERISTEYCDQTDEEKKLGLKVVMPTFDRATCSIPKSQIGFIDFFANDLFEAWHSFGDFPETVDNMNLNYQYWKDQQALVERKAKKLSLESTKVSEAEEDEEVSDHTFAEVEVSAKL